MSLTFIAIIVGIIFAGLFVIGMIMTKMFHRASKEQAFVRTGFGGQKVVKDGGAVILPILHETISINMQTLRLGVSRAGKESLITKDRLRVDVKAEFYVRVAPDEHSIAAAAAPLVDLGQEGSAAVAPATAPRKTVTRAQQEREAQAERDELKRLAGIPKGE